MQRDNVSSLAACKLEPPGQLVTFRVGDYLFGVDVLDVQEVLKWQKMTPVPRAAREVRGLINLRGHIVTAIGMRERLKLDGNGGDEMNLILSRRDGVISLVVDSVGDVIAVDRDRFKPAPQGSLAAPLKGMVTGIYEVGERIGDGLLLQISAQMI
jgi:purine-binding chemotaxis protein CheW